MLAHGHKSDLQSKDPRSLCSSRLVFTRSFPRIHPANETHEVQYSHSPARAYRRVH